ncbi:hypothetical protein INR49_032979 [Caranx melampygus]|nr:hypothetical protein INR49_032979 [Caranx melampygus]
MSPSVSLLLLLLLGLSQALPLQEEGNAEEDTIDITTRILTSNNGTDEILLEGDLLAPRTRNAMVCWSQSCLWRKASNGYVTIPFTISGEFSGWEKQKIDYAMKSYHSRTCIRFVPRQNEYDYISIENRAGCFSALGREGGRQVLSLNRQGCLYHGIIQHEINHALGFQHEQTRSDRDQYVRINWENINQQMAYNFYKQTTNNLNTPYDYSSIMHYGRTAFSINGWDSITPIPDPNVQIGQRQGISSTASRLTLKMTPSVSLLLLLLLGLSQALLLQEEGNAEEDTIDITTRILTSNNGTDEILLEGDLLAPRTRNAMVCWSQSCLWRKASNGYVTIPFTISGEFSGWEKQKIDYAMKSYHSRTCIRFVPRQNEYDYISIENRAGCFSALGREGGRQVLSLNRQGCLYHGIIQHEINHALGFQHEQTRSDRDQYVRINWENINQQMAYNFYKQTTNNLNTPYDYSSIMHYGRTAFSINGWDSITPIPDPNVQIGQRQGMSYWDIMRINMLYGC